MKNYKDRIKSHLETYLRPFMTKEEWEKDGDFIHKQTLKNSSRGEFILRDTRAYYILDMGFNWFFTEQGHFYWSKLHEKIKSRYIESRS